MEAELVETMAVSSGKLDSSVIEAFELGSIVLIKNQTDFPKPSKDLINRVERWLVRGWGLKNPTWDPLTKELHPKQLAREPDANEFIKFLDSFKQAAGKTLAEAIPQWKGSLIPDRVCWRPWELATRRVRENARDDFFHIDHFPNRPSMGNRVIRVFMNLGSDDDIVWASTKPLHQLLEEGRKYGQPKVFRDMESIRQEAQRKTKWWGWADKGGSFHDTIFKIVHDGLKKDDLFQEEAVRKIHHFPPGSIWMAMTDACCHSFLRGSWMVDATWFLPIEYCFHQEAAPAHLLETVTKIQQPAAVRVSKAA
mgnify:FL=1